MITIERELEIAREIIKKKIKEAGLDLVKIILFGSRASGNFTKNSDWDFYIIIDKDIDFSEKKRIITQIKRVLADNKIPNDVIIQSLSIVNSRKDDVGYLTYYALKEGIEI